MPIYTLDDEVRPSALEAYPASKLDVFSASAQEAFSDNISTKFVQNIPVDDLMTKMNHPDIYPEILKQKIYTRDEAQVYAKSKSGVEVQNLPEKIPQEALDILVDRQYQKKVRAEAISSNPDAWGSSFAGSLAGSLVDPVNVAASFIPFVGEERSAMLLKNAGGAWGRAGVRAGIGLIEGAGGAATIEPANYLLSKKLGDDYDSTNSLMNIAMGGVMGAGLHVAVGAVGEKINIGGGKTWDGKPDPKAITAPRSPVIEQLNGMSEAARGDLLKAALAQSLEGKNVDVAPVVDLHNYARDQQVEAIRGKMREAYGLQDTPRVEMLGKKLDVIDENSPMRPYSVDNPPAPIDDAEALSRLQNKNAEEPNSKFIDNEMLQRHDDAISNNPEKNVAPPTEPGSVDEQLKVETERSKAAVDSLTEKYDTIGKDTAPVFKDANEGIKKASDFEKIAKVLAICAGRGER